MTFTKSSLQKDSNMCDAVLCDRVCLLHVGSSVSAVAHWSPIWKAEVTQ